jgi:hypothetical protein
MLIACWGGKEKQATQGVWAAALSPASDGT